MRNETNHALLRRSARATRAALSRDLVALAKDLLPLLDLLGLLVAAGVAGALHHAWFGADAGSELVVLSIWLALSLVLTGGSRALIALHLRHLERAGFLTEIIAVVGAGAVADRFVLELRRRHAGRVELMGIFDDPGRSKGQSSAPDGSIADLVELGKNCRIDWIVLTVPGTEEERLLSIVHRLKALSAPIALCPQAVGLLPPASSFAYIANGMPVALLRDRPAAATESILPRWILTLWALPGMLLQLAGAGLRFTTARNSAQRLSCELDDYDLDRFVSAVRTFGRQRYGYVVTPNVDHLIRLHEDAQFRELYRDASYVLLDSRFLAKLLRLTQGLQLPVCTGSDLTARLFAQAIGPDDPLVLIGGSAQQADILREKYGLRRLVHFNPPMGFIRDPAAVEQCLQFIEAHSPFRYCLLAVGAPQQEILAQRLRARGRARGLALCIGASINFLTGDEQRAPLWLQQFGMEWLYRLLQAPQRLAGRYLIRGPRVFALLRKTEFVLRPAATPAEAMPVAEPVAQAQPYAASFRELVGFDYKAPAAAPPPAQAEQQPTVESAAAAARRMTPPDWRARKNRGPRTRRSPSPR